MGFALENEKRKAGYAVSLVFSLSQHIKDLELLERLAKYLGCGIIRKAPNRETAEWIVTKSDDINQNLIPFLTKYTLSGVKVLDFERFKKASNPLFLLLPQEEERESLKSSLSENFSFLIEIL